MKYFNRFRFSSKIFSIYLLIKHYFQSPFFHIRITQNLYAKKINVSLISKFNKNPNRIEYEKVNKR